MVVSVGNAWVPKGLTWVSVWLLGALQLQFSLSYWLVTRDPYPLVFAAVGLVWIALPTGRAWAWSWDPEWGHLRTTRAAQRRDSTRHTGRFERAGRNYGSPGLAKRVSAARKSRCRTTMA